MYGGMYMYGVSICEGEFVCYYYYYYKLCSQIEVPEHSNCRLVPY